jgi:hypothetical protein
MALRLALRDERRELEAGGRVREANDLTRREDALEMLSAAPAVGHVTQ